MDETNQYCKCPFILYYVKVKVRLSGGKSQTVYHIPLRCISSSVKWFNLFGVGVQNKTYFHANLWLFGDGKFCSFSHINRTYFMAFYFITIKECTFLLVAVLVIYM